MRTLDIFALIGVICGVMMGCISLYEGNNTVATWAFISAIWAFNCLIKTV